MQPDGQIYFDHPDRVPAADTERLERAIAEECDRLFKECLQALMERERAVLERLRER